MTPLDLAFKIIEEGKVHDQNKAPIIYWNHIRDVLFRVRTRQVNVKRRGATKTNSFDWRDINDIYELHRD